MKFEQVLEEYANSVSSFEKHWNELESDGTPQVLQGSRRLEEQQRLEKLIRNNDLAFLLAVLKPLQDQYLQIALNASDTQEIFEGRGAYNSFSDIVNFLLNLCADQE